MNALTKAKIKSVDLAFGDIRDLYFDDVSWMLRYFVVDVGTWLEGRHVLISPESLTEYREDENAFACKLTRQQIHDSPLFDSQKTVSRQQEESLSKHYGWTPYWVTPMAAFPLPGLYTYPIVGAASDRWNQQNKMAPTVAKEVEARQDMDREQEAHLRSFQEIKSYGLQATDGDIGELDDLLLDTASWRVTHIIVDTRKWWPGGQVVIDRALVTDISWGDAKIVVAMSREDVKNAPRFDKDQTITEPYMQQLSQYYQSFKDRLPVQRGMEAHRPSSSSLHL
jgi:hypothetical protein